MWTRTVTNSFEVFSEKLHGWQEFFTTTGCSKYQLKLDSPVLTYWTDLGFSTDALGLDPPLHFPMAASCHTNVPDWINLVRLLFLTEYLLLSSHGKYKPRNPMFFLCTSYILTFRSTVSVSAERYISVVHPRHWLVPHNQKEDVS